MCIAVAKASYPNCWRCSNCITISSIVTTNRPEKTWCAAEAILLFSLRQRSAGHRAFDPCKQILAQGLKIVSRNIGKLLGIYTDVPSTFKSRTACSSQISFWPARVSAMILCCPCPADSTSHSLPENKLKRPAQLGLQLTARINILW